MSIYKLLDLPVRRIALAIMLVQVGPLLGSTDQARGQLIDQDCWLSSWSGCWRISSYGPIGQEFVPSVSEHVGVDVGVSGSGDPPPYLVRIHVGTIDGPVVPGTEVIVDPPYYSTGVTLHAIHFSFGSQPVALIPGMTYVLEIVSDWGICGSWADPYTPGRAILVGEPRTWLDLPFRTWVLGATGACCTNEGCRGDLSQSECIGGNGVWYESEDCISFTCPPICGNGVVEGTEECDPPGSTGCDDTCQWIPITGRIRFDHDKDPETEPVPLNGATVALSAGSFNVDDALNTRVTNANGEFDFGTEHSGLDNLILIPCATNDIVQVKPPGTASQPYCLFGFIDGGRRYEIEIDGWSLAGAFTLFYFVSELDSELQDATQDAPPDVTSNWKNWDAVRGDQQATVTWPLNALECADLCGEQGCPCYNDLSNTLRLRDGDALVLRPDGAAPRRAVTHEYGHFVHDMLGNGLYYGHRITYSEGLAEVFRDLFLNWRPEQLPIPDGDHDVKYDKGNGSGQGVYDLFLDMLDDVDSPGDGGLDGFAVDFRYIWFAVLKGTTTMKNFWKAWLQCEYGQVAPDGLSWNQHIKNIYNLHDNGAGYLANIGEVILPSEGGTLSLGAATLSLPAGAVAEDTTVAGSTEPPTSVTTASDFHVFDGLNGDIVFSLPATLTIQYDDNGMTPEEEATLDLHYYNRDAGRWEPLSGAVDPATDTVTAAVNHLSEYTVGHPTLAAPPAAPTGLHLVDEVSTGGTVTIAWQANAEPDLAGYVVNTATVADPVGTDLFLAADATSHSISAVGPDNYTFTVRASDLDGNQSEASSVTLAVIDDDNDKLPDVWELQWLEGTTSGAEDDDDLDGAENLTEYRLATFPNDADSDDDGMFDGWEIRFGFDPLDFIDAADDPDDDCFINIAEFEGGQTHPRDPNSHPTDCNSNCAWDSDEIDMGTSLDCNATAVPDECEVLDGGDFDSDGRVSILDFAAFAAAMAGPGVPPNSQLPECVQANISAFDSDIDTDVDLRDFAFFQDHFESFVPR